MGSFNALHSRPDLEGEDSPELQILSERRKIYWTLTIPAFCASAGVKNNEELIEKVLELKILTCLFIPHKHLCQHHNACSPMAKVVGGGRHKGLFCLAGTDPAPATGIHSNSCKDT